MRWVRGVKLTEALAYFPCPNPDNRVFSRFEVYSSAEDLRRDGALFEGISPASNNFEHNKPQKLSTFGAWSKDRAGKNLLQMGQGLRVAREKRMV